MDSRQENESNKNNNNGRGRSYQSSKGGVIMDILIGYTKGSLMNPKAGIPIVYSGGTYKTYHWIDPHHANDLYNEHATYEGAKEEAEYWEARGYHVIVRVPAKHKMGVGD